MDKSTEGKSDAQRPQKSVADSIKESFYKGVISRINLGDETGIVLSDSGKEFPFVFPFLRIIGAPQLDIRYLTEGMRVGFDVGWTSKGLRISAIKIYD